ncbi:MAG: VTT domain-containing protein [Anaerolineaceae bacterium]|jgi:membrane protein DedA with SNARE-associated domain|nr:VTT domain-containing protein [Anaerolineaceae bacterium]
MIDMNIILTPLTKTILPYLAMGLASLLDGLMSSFSGSITVSGLLLQPIPVFVTIVSGNLLADMGWYNLGRFVQLERLKRFGKRLKINLEIVDDLALEIQNHAPRILFLAKLTVGLPVPSLIATGLSKVPIRRWIGMLVLAEVIRTATFVTLLFLYASAIGQASGEMQAILMTMTVFVVISGMIWWKRRKLKKI